MEDASSSRNLVVAVPMPLREDPEITLGALRWVIDQALRPGDVVHVVHVIKCMVQKLEVYHGVPGTSYSFEEPGGIHHENEDFARAKSFLAESVMPVLDARGIQHQTHLSVETIEAPPSAVAQIIFSAADSVGADLVVLGANRKPVSAEDGSLGKVAKYALDYAQRPLVITRAFQPVPVAPDA
ncbi:hypothetical protein COCSUDRAFT_53478 [Coccomyxa subellipsoidea C-169]|uniref:UspA domain-containing protein n=1 Tax=Coccomyxa subellipsoidea (strain C-169) TaxID=574566 RepID=I0YX72_COCSC|nr:hypothetical protein COCSUDRAFT_53478 [Coccomyxa subellipsoidea C-169]EIE22991.1 hypothetical protein COCSUDRAFT_53478 [Coccomyxa subellipsoidea C-169]|eukprot:XP_005647535.1 hypothetical protein COCSUDRAFT_53478 [Coccomyxa subellipsoidea C-169]